MRQLASVLLGARRCKIQLRPLRRVRLYVRWLALPCMALRTFLWCFAAQRAVRIAHVQERSVQHTKAPVFCIDAHVHRSAIDDARIKRQQIDTKRRFWKRAALPLHFCSSSLFRIFLAIQHDAFAHRVPIFNTQINKFGGPLVRINAFARFCLFALFSVAPRAQKNLCAHQNNKQTL